jgi:hypothetical protein
MRYLGQRRRLAEVNDLEKYEVFLPTMGAWGRSPQERGKRKSRRLWSVGEASPILYYLGNRGILAADISCVVGGKLISRFVCFYALLNCFH